MKIIALLLIAVTAQAQAVDPAPAPSITISAPSGDMTLGGVPRLIAQKLEEAKPCGLVDFAGHAGGGAYIPTWTFHDKAGRQYVEAADIGYRAIQGAKPSLMLFPVMVNVETLADRAWDFQWANDHVTRSKYPNAYVGVGPVIPADKAALSRLKLKDPKEWLAASASVRFN